jgi:hypothetical protein
MATDAGERLRDYLRQLAPEAQALLMREFERAIERGEEVVVANYVLSVLRKILRPNSTSDEPRGDVAARLFFQSADPFIVDAESGTSRIGQIRRASLLPFWIWLKNCVLPGEMAEFETEVVTAWQAGDDARIDRIVRQYQAKVVEAVGNILSARNSNNEMQRLIGRIGSPDALDDLPTIFATLKNREALDALSVRLPRGPFPLNSAQLHAIRAQLDIPSLMSPATLPIALALVMRRLAWPWQLLRLATAAAETDDEVRVAATPFAVAVQLVLNEVFRVLHELRNDLRHERYANVSKHLKIVHDSVRGIRTELDLRNDSAWGRQMASIRTDISNMIRSEIDSIPGRVRRMLRQRSDKDIVVGATLDKIDVEHTVALIELVETCRNFASELAINEVTQRTYSELEQYLERTTQLLLDGLRASDPKYREFRQSQVEAAIRFCSVIFGDEYAELLSKAAEVAVLGERKAARQA